MHRMQAEGDFDLIEPMFFCTSQAGGVGPGDRKNETTLKDATTSRRSSAAISIVTARAATTPADLSPQLRAAGWRGHWIDAASTLRMKDDAIIVLDPVNLPVIEGAGQGRHATGSAATAPSADADGVGALYNAGLVEWMSTMTYQAASGGGAKHMRELLTQIGTLSTPRSGAARRSDVRDPRDRPQGAARRSLIGRANANFGDPLGGGLLPWIDKDLGNGRAGRSGRARPKRTRSSASAAHDARCRWMALRPDRRDALPQPGADGQADADVPLADIETMIAGRHDWVQVVPNTREAQLRELTPAAVTGTLAIPSAVCASWRWVPSTWRAFTVGDQLLWGAAEPLRRMLRILLEAVYGAFASLSTCNKFTENHGVRS